MKKLVSLMITFALLLTVVSPAMSTPITDEIKKLKASGKLSNDILHYAYIDLNSIEKHGTVSATVYESVYEKQTHNIFNNLTLQTPESCYDKLTRFIFELTNRYRPENTDLALEIYWDKKSVGAWTYGQYKDQAMYSIISGIPDTLNNPPYNPPSSGGSSRSNNSWIDDYSPEKTKDKEITSFKVTSFEIASKTYTVNDEVKIMDVEPYIKDDRTYVPVRYLAYSLGVAEDGVTWDGNARKVGISKDNTDISLIIGSQYMYVNKKPVKMDVAPEITNNRTFLPARWVAEALGAIVEWDDATKQTIIKIPIKEEQGS